MPRFSKKALSQYLRTQCDRQLKLNLYTNEERRRLDMPDEDKIRGQIQLLTDEGQRWQATVLANLDATFGQTHIIGHRKQGQANRFDPAPLDQLIRQARPNHFLTEAKYEVDYPALTFRQTLGVTDLHDYRGEQLNFAAVVPDLIQVLDPSDNLFSHYVTPVGDIQHLPLNDQRLQLRIIDVKLTSEPGASYFAEVAYYAMTLAGWLIDNHLDQNYIVVPEAAVWPGSHQASNLRMKMNEWQVQGYTPSFHDLIQVMEDDLEAVEFDVFAPMIRRLLREKVPLLLHETNWKKHDWHVGSYCGACDFLGYPWGQDRQNPPQPEPEHCWTTADQEGHLSRIAYISRGSSSILRANQIPNVATLAQQSHDHQAFDQHQELRAQRTVIPSRAQALINGNAIIAPNSGTSAVMPKWADLKIYLSTEFDLSSAISFSFGLKAFWLEPFLLSDDQRQNKNWGPSVFFVGSRNINQEEQTFLDFLRTIRLILDEVVQQDDDDVNAGRRTRRSTVQFFLWDSVQQEHLMRVVGRHLDAILGDPQLKDLAWLFPSEELVPNPELSTRQTPITLVSDAIRNHLAAPIPHAYTLLKVVQSYHRDSDAPYVPSVLEFFQDPLSDLIPSERGHEIWIQKQPIPGKFPGYITRLQQFQQTVEKKLRALEMVTSRLRDDLADQLSNQTAPTINISSPDRLPAASWDAQLWYTYARLDAELDKLEKQQILAMPPHEREARFKSARLRSRLVGEPEQQVLATINSRFNLQLRSAPGRYIYELRENSIDVSLKPGEFTFALSPEQDSEFPNRPLRNLLLGTNLETQYESIIYNWYHAVMQDVLGVKVEAIDRENGFIVLTTIGGQYPSLIDDLEREGIIDLRQNVILDPTSIDFFTGKLRGALRAIGNPQIADQKPLVKRALGMQNLRNSPNSPHTPPADFLWDAPNIYSARVVRAWKQASKFVRQNGLDLNFSQWHALVDSLSRRLSIIWGPPGTGKSRTLQRLVIVTVVEAWQSRPQKPTRILVTAGTYTAIDNVILDVDADLRNLLPPDTYELYRVRSKYESPDAEIIARGIDMELNRVHPSPSVINLRQRLRLQQGITIVGMTPEQTYNFMRVGGNAQEELFDLIVLDEASQMDIAHAILPLCSITSAGCLVLAGDDLQLSPIQKAEPPKGLESMVGSIYNFYKNHHGIKPRPLNINYRSNRTITNFGIRAGYNPELRAFSPDLRLNLLSPLPSTKPDDWPGRLFWANEWTLLLDPDRPVVCFIHDDTQSSQSNPFEADAVAVMIWLLRQRLSKTDNEFGLLNDLDEQCELKPVATIQYDDEGFWRHGVGVVTPHKAQMGKIINSLNRTFEGVNPSYIRGAVDTVERYQGQQRDVIIGSFALGDPDAIRNEDEFLYNLNRFNVMASRARAKLILFIAQTVVDHLSNDVEVLRSSRLLKTYADTYCNNEQPMTLGYINNIEDTQSVILRSGRFKYHH